MPIELKMLAFSIILGFVQLFISAQVASQQRSLRWGMGPRDEKRPELTGIPARLERAFRNFMETFPFFAASVLIISVMRMHTNLSGIGAITYFIARVIYVIVYATGTPIIRTVVWFASIAGIFLVLGPLL
jgi:uncharacterized MAPEG superfamily protein